jgi:hypothetical protein
MDNHDFFKVTIKTILKYPKMLSHDNTSFDVNVDQINCMIIANNNSYMISQKMKLYFINFFFSKSKIHVICDYGYTQLIQHN